MNLYGIAWYIYNWYTYNAYPQFSYTRNNDNFYRADFYRDMVISQRRSYMYVRTYVAIVRIRYTVEISV